MGAGGGNIFLNGVYQPETNALYMCVAQLILVPVSLCRGPVSPFVGNMVCAVLALSCKAYYRVCTTCLTPAHQERTEKVPLSFTTLNVYVR